MQILKKIIMYFVLITVLLSGITFLVMQQPTFGKAPEKEKRKRLEQSPNFKDGKFQNLEETPAMHPDVSFWKIMREQLKTGDNRVPAQPIPVVKRDLKTNVPTAEPQITWFGHSTILVQLAGKNILIDPVLSKRASPFQFLGPKNFPGTDVYQAEDFPEIDFLLISHDHFDHLDHETIEKLHPRVKHFYVPLGVGAHLEKWGVAPGKITELDWWDEVEMAGGMKLVSTPARHFSGRGLFNRNETLWTSYVLKTADQAIFLGADSGYGTHFKTIGEKYGPFDLTLLECGQYNENWPNIHMMPEETAQAHLDLKGKVLLPIHWGKFKLALHPWTEPVERLTVKAEALHIKLLLPEIGQRVPIDTTLAQAPWYRQQGQTVPELKAGN